MQFLLIARPIVATIGWLGQRILQAEQCEELRRTVIAFVLINQFGHNFRLPFLSVERAGRRFE